MFRKLLINYSIGEADSIISISMGVGGLEISGGCKIFARMSKQIRTQGGGKHFIHQ